ncbi:hypothetical protein BC831DRAFT_161552, partial [Entophlyctis helioformis]
RIQDRLDRWWSWCCRLAVPLIPVGPPSPCFPNLLKLDGQRVNEDVEEERAEDGSLEQALLSDDGLGIWHSVEHQRRASICHEQRVHNAPEGLWCTAVAKVLQHDPEGNGVICRRDVQERTEHVVAAGHVVCCKDALYAAVELAEASLRGLQVGPGWLCVGDVLQEAPLKQPPQDLRECDWAGLGHHWIGGVLGEQADRRDIPLGGCRSELHEGMEHPLHDRQNELDELSSA